MAEKAKLQVEALGAPWGSVECVPEFTPPQLFTRAVPAHKGDGHTSPPGRQAEGDKIVELGMAAQMHRQADLHGCLLDLCPEPATGTSLTPKAPEQALYLCPWKTNGGPASGAKPTLPCGRGANQDLAQPHL